MPAGLEDKSSEVAVNELGPVHANVYGETPPVTVKLMAPVEAPLQRTSVTTEEAEIAAG